MGRIIYLGILCYLFFIPTGFSIDDCSDHIIDLSNRLIECRDDLAHAQAQLQSQQQKPDMWECEIYRIPDVLGYGPSERIAKSSAYAKCKVKTFTGWVPPVSCLSSQTCRKM